MLAVVEAMVDIKKNTNLPAFAPCFNWYLTRPSDSRLFHPLDASQKCNTIFVATGSENC